MAHFTVHGIIAGIPWANTFWVRNGSGLAPSASDFDAFNASFYGQWVSNFIEHVAVDVQALGSVGLYYGTTGADLGAEHNSTQTGSAVGQGLPSQCSTGISWKVQAHYKGGHPRTYLPPSVQDNLSSSRQFKSAHTSAVAEAANDFLAAVSAIAHGNMNTCHLGTVSFVLRKQWRDPPIFRDFIPGEATVDERIDTQRRRLGPDV